MCSVRRISNSKPVSGDSKLSGHGTGAWLLNLQDKGCNPQPTKPQPQPQLRPRSRAKHSNGELLANPQPVFLAASFFRPALPRRCALFGKGRENGGITRLSLVQSPQGQSSGISITHPQLLAIATNHQRPTPYCQPHLTTYHPVPNSKALAPGVVN